MLGFIQALATWPALIRPFPKMKVLGDLQTPYFLKPQSLECNWHLVEPMLGRGTSKQLHHLAVYCRRGSTACDRRECVAELC